MPFIPDPCMPPVDRRLETAIQVAELAIRIGERLLNENEELKRRLAERDHVNGRRHRTKQPA